MKDLVAKRGVAGDFVIASAATSNEEIGNDVHYGTKRILDHYGIPYERRAARRITRAEAGEWDYVIGMDHRNLQNMRRIFGPESEGRLYKLLEFAGRYDDVADPWYTGDFQATYDDVTDGCVGLLGFLGY